MEQQRAVIIVMGVSGSGKSTIGVRLARRLGWSFVEADQFHTTENIAKMRRSEGLSDADRQPWIDAILQYLNQLSGPAVLACSALTAAIRARLQRELHGHVYWASLHADRATLEERLRKRQHHYAGVGLLDSQLQTFEEPAGALILDARETPDAICDRILREWHLPEA